MKISCVIPTCNPGKFLAEAIMSILNQALPVHEIIVAKNGDYPLQLPQEMRAKVKVIEAVRRAGASQARNIGASLAEGDYIAFLDNDDLWSVNLLLAQSKMGLAAFSAGLIE